MWVFHALRGYSSLLEGYAVGRVFNLDPGYVLKLRNLLHYHVLSLPAATFADTGTVSHIYESLRLTLIVYSMLVLFPVPLMTSPYPTLAGLLRYELESIRDEEWTAMSSLLLWSLTLVESRPLIHHIGCGFPSDCICSLGTWELSAGKGSYT